jgi:hypothetical protein
MMHHFRGLGKPKKRHGGGLELRKTDLQKSAESIDTPWDEVDPAEFFDPEEFGIRRRDFKPLDP